MLLQKESRVQDLKCWEEGEIRINIKLLCETSHRRQYSSRNLKGVRMYSMQISKEEHSRQSKSQQTQKLCLFLKGKQGGQWRSKRIHHRDNRGKVRSGWSLDISKVRDLTVCFFFFLSKLSYTFVLVSDVQHIDSIRRRHTLIQEVQSC